MNANSIAWILLLLPLLVAVAILPGRKLAANLCALLATGAALIVFVLALLLSFSEWGEGDVKPIPWIVTGESEDSFRVIIGLTMDRLSRGMIIAMTGINFFAHVFFLMRMKDTDDRFPPFAELTFFLFAATGLIFSDSLVMMFFFLGLLSVCSHLLIDYYQLGDSLPGWFRHARIGAVVFMIGTLVIFNLTKSIYFGDILVALEKAGSTQSLGFAISLLVIGLFTPASQVPRHGWNPWRTDEGLTLFALFHAIIVIALGVYAVARLYPLITASGTLSITICLGIIIVMGWVSVAKNMNLNFRK